MHIFVIPEFKSDLLFRRISWNKNMVFRKPCNLIENQYRWNEKTSLF